MKYVIVVVLLVAVAFSLLVIGPRLDKDTWEFVNTFAPWLSAMGTFASVIVSLYLARKSRPSIRVSAGIYSLVGMGQRVGDGEQFLAVIATNVGFSPVTITGVIWQIGFGRKRKFLQIPSYHPASAELPKKLEREESARMLFPIEELQKMPDPIADWVRSKRFPRLAIRSVRAGVYTPTAQYMTKLDRSLRDKILKAPSPPAAEDAA